MRYDSLPTLAAKYTHAQNQLTVTERVERARSIVIIKHKYMLMCNHKIRRHIMRCLRNSTVRREIGQWRYICTFMAVCLYLYGGIFVGYLHFEDTHQVSAFASRSSLRMSDM